MMNMRHGKKFSKFSGLPLKSSLKKRKTLCRVNWSPDVKNVVKKSNVKQKKLHDSKLLLKINDNKTTYDVGRMYAEEYDSVIKLRLKKNTNCFGVILLDKKQQKILQVSFNGIIIRRNRKPLEKIKMKIEFGDVIWNMKSKRMKYFSKSKDHGLSWLNNTNKFYGSVCDLKSVKQNKTKMSIIGDQKITYRKTMLSRKKSSETSKHKMNLKNSINLNRHKMSQRKSEQSCKHKKSTSGPMSTRKTNDLIVKKVRKR